MVRLTFRLTSEEYLDFNYYTAWSSPDKRKYRLRYYTKVFLLYSGVAVIYILTKRSANFLIDFSVFGGIGVVYFLLVPYLIKRSVKRRVNEILGSAENKHILEESEVIIESSGITDRDQLSESRYDWEAIVRKAETPEAYYLYTNSHHAIVLPKRILKLQQREELDRLFTEHLSLSAEFSER